MRLAAARQASRAPASPIQPGAAVAAQRRRIITICRTSSTSCSSTATGNIPAPISARRTTIIDTAQLNKKRHIAAKLLLRPGQKVLDIGCGWGGLALYLAGECGADVTGLTLSERAAQGRDSGAPPPPGWPTGCGFICATTARRPGSYDRIVSVGMFEHVGVNHYPAFFGKVNALLAPDGVALLHSIGRMDGPGATNPWLRKYIFPGGYSPALSEVVPVVERARLWITDIEILRLHYAETLRAWRGRFERNRDRIRALYDERFCRMWEIYLVGSEMAFRRGRTIMVFQMQLAKRSTRCR